MAASTTTKAVILDQPSHWESWLFVAKTIADGGDTRKYLNLDLDTDPVVLAWPEYSTPKDVNPVKTTLLWLDAVEKETLKPLLLVCKGRLFFRVEGN
jgi:hypothetical protein